MKYTLLWIAVICSSLMACNNHANEANSITKIEMNLSAFGVESDDYPSINVLIDLKNNLSNCKKTYYDPKYKDATYSFSADEINSIKSLLKYPDLKRLKNKYSVGKTDQPTSTIKIYTNTEEFVIEDYGLKGEYPLQELYKLVYKF